MDYLSRLSLENRKLIVGVDFGTTFSGLAWASTSRADFINIINTWPAKLGTREGMTSPKVPTELRYTSEGTEWGFQIPSIVDRHQWFKIGLNDKTVSSTAGKTSDQLTTDYLAELYKHLMYTLEQNIGASLLRSQQIEFCLTVPAIWREAAKEKTKVACQKAGFKTSTEIHLVSEPEAAAISALHGLDPHGLQVGESFVLCDAGGGTVDLITYTITALHPILSVREAASGTGGLCGSTFLNRRFGEFLTKKLGGEVGWDNEILAEAMDRFDTVIKKQYSPANDGDEGYTVLVPGLANNLKLGIRRSKFTIKPADMRAVFEPIILKIIELVRGQITSSKVPIRAVLLVGGFGQNAYLKERMRAALGGTEVLQPPGAWTAIVSGAVMMGLARASRKLAQVSVVSRAARKHYGVELIIPFNAAVHSPSTRFWDETDRVYKTHAMSWFIRRGEAVEENKPTPITYYMDYLVANGKPKSLSIKVWHDPVNSTAPIHKGNGVEILVTLDADLSHLAKSDLNKTIQTRSDGKQYYVVQGSVEATFLSANTKYVLLCMGKRYDTVTAEYV